MVERLRLKWPSLCVSSHLLETLVHLLEILALVIEILKIERSICLPIAHGCYHISQIRIVVSIATRNSRIPVVCAIIGSIGGNPIEAAEAVERYCPLCSKHLLIGVRRAELRETALNGVFPCFIIIVGKMIVTNNLRSIQSLIYHGVHTRLERKFEALGEVVFDIHIAVPEKVF